MANDALEMYKAGYAVPVSEVLTGSDSDFTFDAIGNIVPNKKATPKNVVYAKYNWQKHEIPFDKYLFFKYHEFPYQRDYDLLVKWHQSVGDNIDDYKVIIDSATDGRTLQVHPFTFCRMAASVYGPMKALDALKLVMHDHINRLRKKYDRQA